MPAAPPMAPGRARGAGSPARRALPLVRSLLVNIAGPWLVYRLVLAALPGRTILALALSALLPALDLGFVYRRRGSLDVIALIALLQLLASLAITLASRSLRIAMSAHALQTGVLGLVFAGSALIGRPLIARLALQTVGGDDPVRRAAFEAHATLPAVRRSFMRMTLVWAGFLCAESAVLSAAALTLPAAHYLLVSAVFTYGLNSAMIWGSIRYGRRRAAAAGFGP